MVGEVLVICKPSGIGVSVRTDDWQVFDFGVQLLCNRTHAGICRKQSVGIVISLGDDDLSLVQARKVVIKQVCRVVA